MSLFLLQILHTCPLTSLRDLQDGDDLDEVEGPVVQLCDEDGGNALEQGGSVHVDRGADGEDETADALGHAVVLLHALHHQGQGGGATWAEGEKKRMAVRALEESR